MSVTLQRILNILELTPLFLQTGHENYEAQITNSAPLCPIRTFVEAYIACESDPVNLGESLMNSDKLNTS